MKLEPGMCLQLAEPSSYGWVDPDPWIYLVVDIVVDEARLLMLSCNNANRVGELSFDNVDRITQDLFTNIHGHTAVWSLL